MMDVEFCTGVDERLDLPLVLPPTLDVVHLTGADVLVADDVADSGKVLQLVRDFCAGSVSSVRTAVVHEPQSVVRCDDVWRRTDRSSGAGRAPPVTEPSIRSASTGPASIVHPVRSQLRTVSTETPPESRRAAATVELVGSGPPVDPAAAAPPGTGPRALTPRARLPEETGPAPAGPPRAR